MHQESYSTEESFKTYIDYMAIKRHFTTDSYDYQKYRGKVKAVYDNFRTRNDVFYFYKMSKKPERHQLMVSNIVQKPDIWIRDLCDETAHERYLEWKKTMDGLTYRLKSDLSKLDENYKENFLCKDKQLPLIITNYMQKQISLETLTILSNISKIFSYWDVELKNNFISKDIIRTCKKYYPFLEIDEKKVRETIKSAVLLYK